MSFAADRRCVQCGCRWRPACPRWAGAAFIPVGLFFIAMAVLPLLHGDFPGIILIAAGLVVGLPAVLFGIGALVGIAGKMEIVEEPSPRRF